MSAEGSGRPSHPKTARVFFALWPPEAIASQLAGIAADHAQQAGGRATRRETIHLTLAFLGDVAVDRLPELQRAAGTVRAAAFDLTLDRFGVWLHNRLCWAGCCAPPTALAQLVSSLADALQAAGFALPDGKRRFAPHVTLVRKVARPETALPVADALTWHCGSFVLVRSQASAAGPIYRTLAEFPLIETLTARS